MAKRVKSNKVRLFLDSGAFSAWSRGEEIRVEDYIAFLHEHESLLWHYVNLDVIPGKFGRRDNSQREVEISAKVSYRNQQAIKDAGLHPIPVFHQGESFHWLEQYLRDEEPYIGLSASKFVRVDEQRRWLDTCFNLLTDSEGKPLVKTHGFALTAFPLVTSYPWYTVDSTTWVLTPGYGQIVIPAYVDGKFDYLLPPLRITISGVKHQSVSSQKNQFEALGPKQQEVVARFLEEHVGTDIARARYSLNERRRCLLVYYLNLCKAIRGMLYRGPRVRIAGKDHYDTSHMKALDPYNISVLFATEFNNEWSALMNEVGATDRLLSYWELRTRPFDVIQKYVQTGSHGVYVRKPLKKADWKSETYLNRRRLAMIDRVEEYDGRES